MYRMVDTVIRPAARVLLFDRDDRLLLFRAVFPERDIRLWITPGGGVHDGESHEEAAHRELWEETGIRDATIGPCVWVRRHLTEFQGRPFDLQERYFVARIDAADVISDHRQQDEMAFLAEHRWWTVDEIAGSSDWFAPRRMAELLPSIVAGVYPVEPIDSGV